MRRGLPDTAPEWQEPANREAIEVELQLITPMFGGGYKTREVDPLMPIRPAAIRGHLRFWWRATAGAQYESAEELYQAETAIWGGAATKEDSVEFLAQGTSTPTRNGETSSSAVGKVAIRVCSSTMGEKIVKNFAKYEKNEKDKYKFVIIERGFPLYALFPFRGQLNKKRTEVIEYPARYAHALTFRVILINCGLEPEQWEEAKWALWAWVNLGGVGARTRRGCGSLRVLSASLRFERGAEECVEKIEPCFFPDIPYAKHASAGAASRMLLTCLQGAEYVICPPVSDPTEAWRKAVEAYEYFRQGVDYARCQGWDTQRNRPQPGRSKWPEPDTIRRLAQKHFSRHSPRYPIDGFPRANLGLPIVFHFKDYSENRSDTDPCDSTLQRTPSGQTRFASPVITKAIANSDGTYSPLVLVLRSPDAWQELSEGRVVDTDLLLRFDDGTEKEIPLSWIELSQWAHVVPPMNGKDVRNALLECVEKVAWKQQNPTRGRL